MSRRGFLGLGEMYRSWVILMIRFEALVLPPEAGADENVRDVECGDDEITGNWGWHLNNLVFLKSNELLVLIIAATDTKYLFAVSLSDLV
jgi:hypothetical protein